MHTDDPGQVIGLATSLGVLSEIEIDNMKEQTAARYRAFGQAAEAAPVDPGLTQVVAVVAGEGNKALFRNLGVDLIVDGGQSMNPSAEDLMRAVERATAPSVVILPNNSNVIMTAEQTAKLTREGSAGGAHPVDPGRADRGRGLRQAQRGRRQRQRDAGGSRQRRHRRGHPGGARLPGRRSADQGQDFIGLVEDQVVIASHELEPVVEEVVARLLDGGREMLTVLLGEDDSAGRVAEVVDRLRARYPGVEIDVHEGGQPFYPLLLSAE